MSEVYLFYTMKLFAPRVWYSSGSGEKYSPDSLPMRIEGYVRFEWDSVIVFVPELSALHMVERGGHDACFCITRMTLTLRSVTNARPVQFASYYAMLQHMHTLIVDQKYVVSSVTKDDLFLRAGPKRRSSWASCFMPVSNRVSDEFSMSPLSRYHPPLLRRAVSGKAVVPVSDSGRFTIRLRTKCQPPPF